MHASERCQRVIVEAVYASWAAQDLAAVSACVHRDAVYEQHLPPGAWPIAGILRGKENIVGSLAQFLREFEVIEYRPLKIACRDGVWVSRVAFHYGHKPSGHSMEAVARTRTKFEGDKIRTYEIIHDAQRLRAFFEMVSRMGVEA